MATTHRTSTDSTSLHSSNLPIHSVGETKAQSKPTDDAHPSSSEDEDEQDTTSETSSDPSSSDDSDDDEETTTTTTTTNHASNQASNPPTKPTTTKPQPSDLKSRLLAFLPALAASNADLAAAARQPGFKNLEDVAEGEDYIELDLGLGVLEEKSDGGDVVYKKKEEEEEENERMGEGETEGKHEGDGVLAELLGRKKTQGGEGKGKGVGISVVE